MAVAEVDWDKELAHIPDANADWDKELAHIPDIAEKYGQPSYYPELNSALGTLEALQKNPRSLYLDSDAIKRGQEAAKVIGEHQKSPFYPKDRIWDSSKHQVVWRYPSGVEQTPTVDQDSGLAKLDALRTFGESAEKERDKAIGQSLDKAIREAAIPRAKIGVARTESDYAEFANDVAGKVGIQATPEFQNQLKRHLDAYDMAESLRGQGERGSPESDARGAAINRLLTGSDEDREAALGALAELTAAKKQNAYKGVVSRTGQLAKVDMQQTASGLANATILPIAEALDRLSGGSGERLKKTTEFLSRIQQVQLANDPLVLPEQGFVSRNLMQLAASAPKLATAAATGPAGVTALFALPAAGSTIEESRAAGRGFVESALLGTASGAFDQYLFGGLTKGLVADLGGANAVKRTLRQSAAKWLLQDTAKTTRVLLAHDLKNAVIQSLDKDQGEKAKALIDAIKKTPDDVFQAFLLHAPGGVADMIRSRRSAAEPASPFRKNVFDESGKPDPAAVKYWTENEPEKMRALGEYKDASRGAWQEAGLPGKPEKPNRKAFMEEVKAALKPPQPPETPPDVKPPETPQAPVPVAQKEEVPNAPPPEVSRPAEAPPAGQVGPEDTQGVEVTPSKGVAKDSLLRKHPAEMMQLLNEVKEIVSTGEREGWEGMAERLRHLPTEAEITKRLGEAKEKPPQSPGDTGQQPPEGEPTAPVAGPKPDPYDQAVAAVRKEGRGSISVIQRETGVGYGTASRMLDRMEKEGVVGPRSGAQAREVLPVKEVESEKPATPSQIGKQNAAENRSQGVQDAQEGKITPEAFKLAMQQHAQGRLAEENRKQKPDATKVTALQKIIDDAGRDTGGAVETMKAELAKNGAGYKSPLRPNKGPGQQNRGGYKEPEDNRDPIIETSASDPETRDKILDKSIAAVRAGQTDPLVDRVRELVGTPFDDPQDTIDQLNTLRDKGHSEAKPEEPALKPPNEVNPLGRGPAKEVQKTMLSMGGLPGQGDLFNTEGSEPERDPILGKAYGSVMPSMVSFPENVIAQVKQGLGEVVNLFRNRLLPALRGTSPEVADAANSHAGSVIAAKPIVADLMTKVFGPKVDMPLSMKVGKTLNADNLLGILDGFVAAGDTKAEEAWRKVNDEAKLNKLVLSALRVPDISKAVANWKTHVNPFMDEMWNQIRRVDPDTENAPRGRHTEARINLLTTERAKRWAEFSDNSIANKPPSEVPDASAAAYRNPDVKRDVYMRRAKGTADYSNNPGLALLAALAPRYNQATKIGFLESLAKAGVAVIEPRRAPGKPLFQGPDGYDRLPMRLPETDLKTGVTKISDRAIWVRPDLTKEVKGVLNTDMRGNPSVVLKALTGIQMMGFMDLASHSLNVERGAMNSLGSTRTAFGDWLVQNAHGLNIFYANLRLAKKYYDAHWGNDETLSKIAARKAELAKIGALRPQYNIDETNKGLLQGGAKFLHGMDTVARLMLDDNFTNLVNRGVAQDTPGNRRDFINQIGQYNRRAMGDFEKKARDWGLSPFIVAGKTMTHLAIRNMIGDPGFKATSEVAALQSRMILLSKWLTIPLAAGVANYLLTGKAQPPGALLGQIYLGKDKDGKTRTIDLWQLEGMKRGMRATGVAAALEGLQRGRDMDHIIGQGFTDAYRTALHPIVGPGLGFLSKLGGLQLDMRGNFQSAGVPKTGSDIVKNANEAAKAQNPFLYYGVQSGGKVDPRMAGSIMAGLGVTSQPSAMEQALHERFAGFTPPRTTPEEDRKHDAKTKVRNLIEQNQPVPQDLASQLAPAELKRVHKEAAAGRIARELNSPTPFLGAVQAAKLATPEEWEIVRPILAKRYLSEAKQVRSGHITAEEWKAMQKAWFDLRDNR